MFKKQIVLLVFFLPVFLSAQSVNDLVGIYVQEGTPIGLEVFEAPTNGLIIQQVLIKTDGEIVPFEWQKSYISTVESALLTFHWMTGRYEDTPETNDLIVYELVIRDGDLEGQYFFPNETRTPPSRVKFVKLK